MCRYLAAPLSSLNEFDARMFGAINDMLLDMLAAIAAVISSSAVSTGTGLQGQL